MGGAPRPSAPGGLARDLSGRKLGRYEVLSQLASGGMATVYVARAQGVAGFERLVAIKVLHPHLAHDEDFISMFLDEARLAARIRHPNVVGTLDISDSQGDGYFLVMEYVEGDHFGALMRSAAKGGQRLPVAVISRLIMDALSGLAAAHAMTDASGSRLDLVHRDVSPHNILVGTDGVARITDFGVAKAQVRLSSTRDGQFKGKLSYMAPEQAASGESDQRSDLFSMGIVLWEALTGRRLFRGENNADVLNKVLACEVPEPSQFDEALVPFDAVVKQALAREPVDRFQSADDMLEAVEQAAKASGGTASPRAVVREMDRWLAEKISAERKAVRGSIESLGHSELGKLPRPRETGSQPSHPHESLVRPIAPEEATMGARPSSLAPSAAPKRTSPILFVLAAIGLAAVGSMGAFLVFSYVRRAPAQGAAAPPMNAAQPTPSAPPPTQIAPVPQEVAPPVAAPVPEVTPVEPDTETAPDRVRSRHRVHRSDHGNTTEPGGGEQEDEPIVNPYRH